MGYIDSLIDFKTTDDGEIIYYPFSFWGKGYIVPNLEKKTEIQAAAKRIYKLYFFSFFVCVVGWAVISSLSFGRPWWWFSLILAILVIVGGGVWCQKSLRDLALGLVPSNIRISLLESYTHSARSLSFIWLVFLETGSLYLAAIGLQITSEPEFYPWEARPLAILDVVFFGLSSLVFLYVLIMKVKTVLRM